MATDTNDEIFLLSCPCGQIFAICRGCYRGHRYCSELCRRQARRKQMRAANCRHQSSPEGRLDHCDCQRRYRQRCRARASAASTQEDVTDQSSFLNPSPPLSGCAFTPTPKPTPLRCRICGRIADFLNPYRRILPTPRR